MSSKELDLSAETPWGEIGYLVYKRTYARRLTDKVDSPTEEFPQTVARIIDACRTQLKCGFTEEEEQKLADYLLSLKGSVAGRFWWQLGTKTVGKLGLASLQNCAGVLVDHGVYPFTWTMDMLMLGCGVGFNIQREHVYQIPKLTKKKVVITRKDDASADFIVPDTREGWVKLLGKVLKAYFYGGDGFTYSTQLIRGRGAAISGFGGTASGAEVLVEGIGYICGVLDARRGKRVRPIDCLDIMNIIGMIVVAGNVRRSAEIAVGDYDDIEFLNAKRWDLGNIPKWRGNSNNSVACSDVSLLPQEFWDGYTGGGEPYGLINLELAKSCGRLGETQYPDEGVVIFNPCAEQGLNNLETCCLAEIFLSNITSKEELIDVAKILYRINKHSLTLPCHNKGTEAIVHKNMRMGIGITGWAVSTPEQRSWLGDTYDSLREFDKEYSKLHGFNESIKITTVKPSGSLSLLAGVSSGAHGAYAPYYIRRVRIASDSPLVEKCRTAGYPIEFQQNIDGSIDHTTQVVEFPCVYPDGSDFIENQSAIQQLETVKQLQTVWSDNAVSVTVSYKLEELPEIKDWLATNFTDNVKTVSFMLYSDHGFNQAPLEKITKEEYEARIAVVTPITSISFNESDISESQIGCEAGVCPIK